MASANVEGGISRLREGRELRHRLDDFSGFLSTVLLTHSSICQEHLVYVRGARNTVRATELAFPLAQTDQGWLTLRHVYPNKPQNAHAQQLVLLDTRIGSAFEDLETLGGRNPDGSLWIPEKTVQSIEELDTLIELTNFVLDNAYADRYEYAPSDSQALVAH